MQIALYKDDSTFFGKAVNFFTRGPYSHCSVVLDDGTVIEARPLKGVQEVAHIREGVRKGCVIELYDVYLSPQQKLDIETFLRAQIGKKYDYWSVLMFVFLSNKPRKKDSERWFCSELVFAAFVFGGIALLNNIPAWKVAPMTLATSTIMFLVQKFVV
jgi:uncharacterized protein YycO